MAVGRFLEITVGVVCSAIVATTIFPMHIGPAVKVRVTKALQDTKILFEKILIDEKELENYSAVLSNIARDIADIHVMAVHLSYEKSTLKGMTKPLQEMLHQLSMLVTNLVAMAERIKQLDQIDLKYREKLKVANVSMSLLKKCVNTQTYFDRFNISICWQNNDIDYHYNMLTPKGDQHDEQ